MARPLRIQYPGACYHLMNRGNSRQEIFFTDEDRGIFLSGLMESCGIYGVRLIAYVLMANHFHLIVQTEQANLSAFMRHFLVSYTVRINRKWARSGHVFQGRYKSLIIDKDSYLLPLSRYIHLNPIRSKEFREADITRKMEYLKGYGWSSLPGYCFPSKRNKVLDYQWLLDVYWGGDNGKGRKEYWRYVCQGIEGEIGNPFAEVIHQTILGTKEFVEWVREKVSWGREREVPALRRMRRSLGIETVLGVMGSALGVEPVGILNRRAKEKFIRQMAMELCYRYCSLSQRELGEKFGVDYSTISQNRCRLKRRLQGDKKMQRQFGEMEQKIESLSKRKI